MAYAQKDYPQIQGINGKYPISSIGCFITSFCNLEARFGVNVDPPTINNYFINNDIYIDVDDGIRDDVGFGTISTFDHNTVVTGTGSGVPPTANSIVKFVYSGGKTHFCLVDDVNRGTIVDSWDGVIKSWNVYGGPVEWASYASSKPVPIQGYTMPPITQAELAVQTQAYFFRDPNADEIKRYVGVADVYRVQNDFNPSPERQQVIETYNVGKTAQTDAWANQIYSLEDQLKVANADATPLEKGKKYVVPS